MTITNKGDDMFGYIKIFKPELKFKDFELYKGIYCSLCKQLGKEYGLTSRFLLNYDYTFLSLCLLSLSNHDCEFKKSSCSFCFAKKCLHCTSEDDIFRYAAALTVITTYHKLIDNLSDEKHFKKIPYYVCSKLIKNKYNKAKKFYPEITEIIENQMKIQSDFEKEKKNSIDHAAHATATSLAEIFSFVYGNNDDNIYRFGYCLGRFIYISDALDDLEKDFKNINYNPFISDFNNSPDFIQIRTDGFAILDTTADELAKAYESIPFGKYKEILSNIIYYGLDNTINIVLRKEKKTDEKSL